MIKIIVILFILLFLYYVGLFLYKTFQKGRKSNSGKEQEVYHFERPIQEEVITVDVKEEFEKLEQKKKLAGREDFIREREELKKNKGKGKSQERVEVKTKENIKEEPVIDQIQESAFVDDVLGGISVDDLINIESGTLKTLHEKIEDLSY